VKPSHLRLVILLLALPLIGFHLALKQHPDAKAVGELRNAFKRSAEWQGKLAPDFELDMLDGSRFKIADHIGREVVVLNFFATWCGPCKAEMPELHRFQAQRQGQPFLLIGIDAEEKLELVEAFVRDLPVAFPVGIDGTGFLQKSFGVDSYPTTILIGSDGRIQLYQSGRIMNADVAFASFVDASLEQIRRGQGLSKDAYLAALKSEPYPTPAGKADEPKLGVRARQITAGMDCPCGCSDTLQKCACNTARKAKARLASLPLEGRNDADVKQELNREFCMKGMQ
jgi:thiol-disulfide isomerase/thioredoxin